MNAPHPAAHPIRDRMMIGGEWSAGSTGATFDVFNPATGEVIAKVPQASDADVDRAVQAARAALVAPAWKGLTPYARERLICKLADLVEANADEIAGRRWA